MKTSDKRVRSSALDCEWPTTFEEGHYLKPSITNAAPNPSANRRAPFESPIFFRKIFIQQTSFSAVCGHQPD
ncbi:conserved hypothetical protein [Ralstonia solanacearum IPO1609]|uniref:Uncharacterized protein n=1 Tax=Ralstonia solanacearum IPO1609 TaxID=564066 RepID=A0ABF7RCM1_RALSL|nr:conserved hypothetical protein [Ralstonia solanacearum IPO1609]